MTTTNSTNLTDHELARRIALFLQLKHTTLGSKLRVEARGGVVTVSGHVASDYQRQAIRAFVRRVAGVVNIVDKLQVAPPLATAAKAVRANTALVATLLIATAALAGCGQQGPPRVPVFKTTGKVLFQNQPPAGALVVLHPRGATPDAPRPTAQVKPDGTFEATTFDSGDGAPQGEYVVTVQWFPVRKVAGDFVPGPNVLPKKYSTPESSNLIVRVAEGENSLPPITLQR